MGGFEPVVRVCSRIDMKGEAQFQTGEVWEEGLRRRMPNPLDICRSNAPHSQGRYHAYLVIRALFL